jgi:hypothetical protein
MSGLACAAESEMILGRIAFLEIWLASSRARGEVDDEVQRVRGILGRPRALETPPHPNPHSLGFARRGPASGARESTSIVVAICLISSRLSC